MGKLTAIATTGLALIWVSLPPMVTGRTLGAIAQAQTSTPAKKDSAADRQLQQGLDQYKLNQFEAALASFQQALAGYQAQGDRLGEGKTIRQLGRVYFALEKYPEALSNFQQSLKIAREVGNREEEGRSLGNLGAVYANLKDEDNAVTYYKQSIQVAKAISDLYGEAISQENLGLLYSGRNGVNDFAETYTAYNRSLEIWRILKDRKNEAHLLLTLGNFYKRWASSGRCSSAIEVFEQSLPLLRELKNRTGEGVALGGLGACYEHQNKYIEAVDALKNSVAIAQEVKSRRNEGIALNDLAKTYAKVLALGRAYPKTVEELYVSLNEPQAALQYAQQGLQIALETKNQWGEATALDNLGRIYAATDDPRQAIVYFDRRLALTRTLKNTRAEVDTLNTLGLAYSDLKNYRQSIKHHQQAVAIQRPWNEDYILRLQKIAEQYKSKTKDTPLHEFRESLSYLGDAYHKNGDYAKAVQSYQEAFGPPLTERTGGGDIDIKLLGKLGESFAESGQLSTAEANLRQALQMEEDIRLAFSYSRSSSGESTDLQRIRLAERQAENYRRLQKILVRQNNTDAALEVSEQARSRTLVELLTARQKGNTLTKPVTPPPTPVKNGANPYASSEPNPYDAPPLKLGQIRQVAKTQNATLVQYSLINDELLYAWVIQPNGQITFRSITLDPKVPLDQQIADSRSAIGARGRIKVVYKGTKPQEGNVHLTQLHRVLVEPIADQLPQNPDQRVVFLPQGSLNFVPFPALRDSQGKFLIETHTISTAPSIQTLQLTKALNKRSRTTGQALVVGDPTMPRFEQAQLPALPGARQEAFTIASLLQTQPLIGEQATKAAVLERIKTAPMIHLATHGLLNTVSGDAPGAVALAPSGQDTGFLTASEIFDLDLQAKLVVLSACDTARGEVTSDGVVGLSRSLIAAGVPSVVVSLWAVDDQSTNTLMGHFYKNLQTNPDKAQAMRQAMLSTMQQYPNPLDWAAFTLVGESE